MIKPFRISDEEIVKTYLETKSLKKTALIAQGAVGTKAVSQKLKSLGIEVKNYNLKPIKASDEELSSMYNSGMSLIEITKEVSGSKGAMKVRERLQKIGIDTSYGNNVHKYKEKMSKSSHQYALDEHVFDSIDTEEKAYWLGFLMADGYNHESRTAICLRLQAEDVEILEKFKKFLRSNAPIYTMHRTTKTNHLYRTYKEVRVCSIHLSRQLAFLGCTQGKTYNLEYPTCVPSALMNHFIRGYFDGDGCICISKRSRRFPNRLNHQLTIVGREDFLLKIQDWLVKEASVNRIKLAAQKSECIKALHYGGFNVVVKILNYLYRDAKIFLERKHNKYLQMVVRQSNLQ